MGGGESEKRRGEKVFRARILNRRFSENLKLLLFLVVRYSWYCIVVVDGGSRLNTGGNIEFCVAGIMLEVNSPCKIKSAEEKAFI